MNGIILSRAMHDSQVCTDSGLILVAEALIDILIHERGLADTRVQYGQVRLLRIWDA
jgi:hypothetical protein